MKNVRTKTAARVFISYEILLLAYQTIRCHIPEGVGLTRFYLSIRFDAA